MQAVSILSWSTVWMCADCNTVLDNNDRLRVWHLSIYARPMIIGQKSLSTRILTCHRRMWVTLNVIDMSISFMQEMQNGSLMPKALSTSLPLNNHIYLNVNHIYLYIYKYISIYSIFWNLKPFTPWNFYKWIYNRVL